MPGAGTDHTREWSAFGGPVVVLVEPQLGENIGTAARAMANFGLTRLRLVRPRDAWPNVHARRAASGADAVLENAVLYDSLQAALADCSFVLATTARAHDQAKPVIGPADAAVEMAPRLAAGDTVAVVFGRERWGLMNDEVGLADRIMTFPVNPAFASLNLAQAVLIVAYEWFKAAGGGLPFAMPQRSPPARKEQLFTFFATLERELERVEFFRPAEKRDTMTINLRNIFIRLAPSQQDIQTLHGVITAIAEGRKGPARGGILDSREAGMLRELLAEHGGGRVPGERGPVRGLSRLLRRNPTDAERTLWEALTRDRRFAGRGFKRQVPVGPHIADIVSFPLRAVIDLVPDDESAEAAQTRGRKRAWLKVRDYRVCEVTARQVEADVEAVLDGIAGKLGIGGAV
ncbi:MAG TPA: TrmJ/YjtD family RNA methyltransferase [Xanthobacteraceae bacterium]|nr:TrmJ/YjtD family RNA methyltransferase [Xanthobacteraceae bacterium]